MNIDPEHLENGLLNFTVQQDPTFNRGRTTEGYRAMVSDFSDAAGLSPEELDRLIREQAAAHETGGCPARRCQLKWEAARRDRNARRAKISTSAVITPLPPLDE